MVTRSGAAEATVYIGGGRRVTIGAKQVAWAKRWLNENASGRSPAKVSDVVAVGDLVRVGQNAEGTWYLRQAPKVTGALVSLSPQDGAIRALVGGYVFGDSKFNRAVDARRQPGSSFKPFIYAAALEKGWTAASRVKDEPIRVPLGRGEFWEPDNFDHKTMGVIPMRTAVALSRNLAAVNTLQSVGLKYATDFVTRFGFDLAKIPLGLSMALGTAEVSPLKMAEAYAVFANGGFRVEPYLIQRIETAAGERVFEATPAHACSDCWFRYGTGDGPDPGPGRRPRGGTGPGPAPRLRDAVPARGGHHQRHGHPRQDPGAQRHRRQDRDHQRRARLLVLRLSEGLRDRRLDGLR